MTSTCPRVGADEVREVGQQPRGEPVPGHDDDIGVELLDVHGLALAHVRSRGGRVPGQASHPACGLKRAVGWVQDRTVVQAVEGRSQLVDPVDGEPVFAQGVVLT